MGGKEKMTYILAIFEGFIKKLTNKENLIPRVISVIIACMLWVYVSIENNPVIERTYEVRLNQINLPTNMTVYNAPEKISVRVRGSRTTITERAVTEISAVADFKNVTEGQQKVPVVVKTKIGKIVAINPSEASVYIDTISQKSVPVQTRMVGTVPEDMTLGNVAIKPNTVIVKGATHRIDKVNMVVAPVDVTDKRDSFEFESELVAVSDDGYDIPNMVIAPQRVIVSAVMVPQMLTVELPIELVTVGTVADGSDIRNTIEPQKVRVSAPPSKLKGITAVKTKPLDVSKLVNGATPVVELDLPENAISNIRVAKVHVELGYNNLEKIKSNPDKTGTKSHKNTGNKHETKN